MYVLGIESSCDETAAAVYHTVKGLCSHQVYSQVDLHAAYGGVVPELASRDHARKLLPVIEGALEQADIAETSLGGVAYTAGPGLAGALLVGAATGRSLALSLEIPAVAVHHMEAHLLAPLLEPDPPEYPFVALLVSGGHTQLVAVKAFGQYEMLGESLDDAAGEAFDKTATLLGLGYPGGPALAQLAESGRSGRYEFPRPMTDRPGLDFSFSGLKTFAMNTLASAPDDEQTRADIALAFEEAVVATLIIKCRRALQSTGLNQLIIAGGVGANQRLRQSAREMAEALAVQVFYPRLAFCTDNAAMVAYTGALRLQAGHQEGLSFRARPRWPMTELSNEVAG